MENALKNILERRSVRRYKACQITREELDSVISAGVCAPSG